VPGRWKKLCGAKTRKQTSCRCKALKNGRCRLHGGLSTGPRTVEGKMRSAKNLVKARAAIVGVSAGTRSEWAKRSVETRRKNAYRRMLISRGLIKV